MRTQLCTLVRYPLLVPNIWKNACKLMSSTYQSFQLMRPFLSIYFLTHFSVSVFHLPRWRNFFPVFLVLSLSYIWNLRSITHCWELILAQIQSTWTLNMPIPFSPLIFLCTLDFFFSLLLLFQFLFCFHTIFNFTFPINQIQYHLCRRSKLFSTLNKNKKKNELERAPKASIYNCAQFESDS